jgi:hypothetical protein
VHKPSVDGIISRYLIDQGSLLMRMKSILAAEIER